jgi:hypothetical protein
MGSIPSKGSVAGGQDERLSSNFYVLLFPLFLIASHSPHPSSPVLLLCLLYRLTADALGGDDVMGEVIGGSVQQQCWAGVFDGGGVVGQQPAAARQGVTQQSNHAGGGASARSKMMMTKMTTMMTMGGRGWKRRRVQGQQ